MPIAPLNSTSPIGAPLSGPPGLPEPVPMPEPLVRRFYAAAPTRGDMLRLLTGKPPVPVHRAIRALVGAA